MRIYSLLSSKHCPQTKKKKLLKLRMKLRAKDRKVRLKWMGVKKGSRNKQLISVTEIALAWEMEWQQIRMRTDVNFLGTSPPFFQFFHDILWKPTECMGQAPRMVGDCFVHCCTLSCKSAWYTPWAKEEFWLLKYFSSLFRWCPQLWIHLFFPQHFSTVSCSKDRCCLSWHSISAGMTNGIIF